MDSITQATLGAAIGEALLGKKIGIKGAFLGAIVATIPDLDVVLLPFLNPLDRLCMHRGYSHSVLFSFLAAFLFAYLLSRIKWFQTISFKRLYWFTWLALITHMILDAFTPYGTMLFLPFSNERIGLDSINIIDPIYTIPLLCGLLLSLFSKDDHFIKEYANRIGLILSSTYLVFTIFIKRDIEHKFYQKFEQEQVEVIRMLSEPVGVGSIKWYGLGRTKDGFYLGSYSYLDDIPIALTFFPSNDHLLDQLDKETKEVMTWFAKDFYHVVQEGKHLYFYNMQVDMQGVTRLMDRTAPTKGYFILENTSNGRLIGSGRH